MQIDLCVTNLHLSLFHVRYSERNKISINVFNLIEHFAQYEKENSKYQIISGLLIYFD